MGLEFYSVDKVKVINDQVDFTLKETGWEERQAIRQALRICVHHFHKLPKKKQMGLVDAVAQHRNQNRKLSTSPPTPLSYLPRRKISEARAELGYA